MAFYGKLYTLEKNENFDSFIKSLNIPQDRAEAYVNSKPSQKIEKDGDYYIITTNSIMGVSEIKFKPGVEFDEVLTPEITTKTTVTVDGNKFTQVQTLGDKSVTYVREYTPEQLVITLTSNFWDGTAKRYYVAK
ncbi:fatty acid-binding protein 2-like [Zerene cesonia]|uniref:fatty acid-binding protein 2-like n=1 Tax=Zerene cesonia TaxID=33412 RepID=UPI0018E51DD8|nr:fatty acid-binding protein 2-like [Zerene cesonia]